MHKRILSTLLGMFFVADASALPPVQSQPKPALSDRSVSWILLCSDRSPVLGANSVVVTFHADGEYVVTPAREGDTLPAYLVRGETRPQSKEWRFIDGGGVGPDGDGINTWMWLPNGVSLICKRMDDE